MRLRALRVLNVRRFAGEGIAIDNFGDGLNVFAEPNEAGKSTLFDALFALVFCKHRSSAKEIKRLQPYSGGGPLISADFEWEGGLYRVEKRFLKRAMARVVDCATGDEIARSDEAEEWIEKRLGAGAGSAMEFLWVRQGESSDLAGGGEVRAEALGGVVEEEISLLTGGSGLRNVAAHCEEALSELINKRGAPAGAYKAAVENEDGKAQNRKELDKRLKAARKDIADLNGKRKQEKACKEPGRVQAAQEEERTARSSLEEAREEARMVKTLTMELRIIGGQRDAEVKALEAFDRECAEARSAKDTHTQCAAGKKAAQKRFDKAVAVETQARTNRSTLEAALKVEQGRLMAAEKGEKRAALIKSRGEAQGRLAGADKALANLDAALAKVEAAQVPPEAVRRLEEIEGRIATAKASKGASSTGVRIRYEKAASEKVRIGDQVLEQGTEILIDEPTALTIPKIGVMSVLPPNASGRADAEKQLVDAQKAMVDELRSLGCASINEARERADTRTQAEQSAAQHKAELKAFCGDGDLKGLRLEVAGLEQKIEALGEDTADAGADSTLPTVEEAAATVDARERECEPARVLDARAKDQLQTERLEVTQADSAVTAAVAALAKAIDRSDAASGWPGTRKRLESVAEEKRVAYSTHDSKLSQVREKAGDIAMATSRLERAKKTNANRKEKLNELARDIAVLDDRLSRAQSDAVVEEAATAAGRHEAAQARVREYAREVAALQRLQAALEGAQGEVKERFLAPVNAELGPLLRLLYGGGSLAFDNETLAPDGFNRNGIEEDIAALSGGTREQISILTRLAFAKLLARSGTHVPVIFDDALIFSDDDRIEKMFTVLHAQTKELQIVVFTCRQRAFESLGGNMLRITDWDALENS